jgi:hypothetical protein
MSLSEGSPPANHHYQHFLWADMAAPDVPMPAPAAAPFSVAKQALLLVAQHRLTIQRSGSEDVGRVDEAVAAAICESSFLPLLAAADRRRSSTDFAGAATCGSLSADPRLPTNHQLRPLASTEIVQLDVSAVSGPPCGTSQRSHHAWIHVAGLRCKEMLLLHQPLASETTAQLTRFSGDEGRLVSGERHRQCSSAKFVLFAGAAAVALPRSASAALPAELKSTEATRTLTHLEIGAALACELDSMEADLPVIHHLQSESAGSVGVGLVCESDPAEAVLPVNHRHLQHLEIEAALVSALDLHTAPLLATDHPSDFVPMELRVLVLKSASVTLT